MPAAAPPRAGAWSGYALSAFTAVTNSVLVNIQDALEDPFDGDTMDDITLTLFEPTWSFWEADTPMRSSQGRAAPP